MLCQRPVASVPTGIVQIFEHDILPDEHVTMEIVGQPGNDTTPLMSTTDLARMGAILNLQGSTISLRGKVPEQVSRTKSGLLIIPVTKSAVDRWASQMAEGEDKA